MNNCVYISGISAIKQLSSVKSIKYKPSSKFYVLLVTYSNSPNLSVVQFIKVFETRENAWFVKRSIYYFNFKKLFELGIY